MEEEEYHDDFVVYESASWHLEVVLLDLELDLGEMCLVGGGLGFSD